MKKALAAILIVAALMISIVPASLASEGIFAVGGEKGSSGSATVSSGLGTLTISKELGTKVSYGGGNGGYHFEATFPTEPNNHSHYDHNLDRYLGNNNNNNGNWFQYNEFTYDEGTDTFTYLDWDADAGDYKVVSTEGYARFDLVQGDKLKFVGEYLISYDKDSKEFILTLVTDADYLTSIDATFSISNNIVQGMKNKNSFAKGVDPDEYIWTTSPGQLAFPKSKPMTVSGDQIRFKAPWVKFTDDKGELKNVNLHLWIDGATGYKNTGGAMADRMFEVEVTSLPDMTVKTVLVPINGSVKLNLAEGNYFVREVGETNYKAEYTVNGKTTTGGVLVYVDAKGASVKIKNIPGENEDLGVIIVNKTVEMSDEYIEKYVNKNGELPALMFNFTVTDEDGAEISSFSLAAGGFFAITDLTDGVYTIAEEEVDMPGWFVTFSAETVTISGDDIAFVNVENNFEITGYDLEITKFVETDDGYDYPDEDFAFIIFEAILDDGEYTLGDELFSGSCGDALKVLSVELNAGAYFVYEDMTDAQKDRFVFSETNDNVYEFDGESYILVDISDDSALNVYNDIRYYEFTVTKLVQNGCGYILADEEFTFVLNDENGVVDTQTTVNGVATFKVPFGDYYVTEEMNDSQELRYVVNQDEVTVDLFSGAVFKNDIRYYTFEVTKKVEVDGAGYEIGPGYTFKLFDTDDNFIQFAKTGTDGVAKFVVPYGNYYVKEFMTVSQSNTYEFGEQNADGRIDVVLDGKICFFNDLKRGSITVSLEAMVFMNLISTTTTGYGQVTGGYTFDPVVAGSNDHSVYYHNLPAALGDGGKDWSQYNVFRYDGSEYSYEVWEGMEYVWETSSDSAEFDFVKNNDVVEMGSWEISYLGDGDFYIRVIDGSISGSTISISNTIDSSGKNNSIYSTNANKNFQQFYFQGEESEFTIHAPWVDMDKDVYVYITGNLKGTATMMSVATVGAALGEEFDVLVTDEFGEFVAEGKLTMNDGEITFGGLLPGNYTVEVSPPDGGDWTLLGDGVFIVDVIGGEDTFVFVGATQWL